MTAEIIDTRRASALFEDATISPLAEEVIRAMGLSAPAHIFLALAAAAYGGLWTYGSATLTSEALKFEPNKASPFIMAHSDTLHMELPLGDIRSVSTRAVPGFPSPHVLDIITGIIDISVATGQFSLSCSRSEAFAQKIRDAAGLK